jgi:hypothetical protein
MSNMSSALLHSSSTQTVEASVAMVRTKMLASGAHPRPSGQYGAMVDNERRDLGLVANQCPPLSRLRGALAYRGHISRKAMTSD